MRTTSHFYQEQESLWYLGGRRIIQALGERMSGGSGVDLVEFVTPARAHVFTYRRTAEDEALYAIQGEATMTCGDQTVPARAGTFMFLPCGISHHLEVAPDGHFHYLRWMTPVGFAHDAIRMGIPGQALVLAPPLGPDEAKVHHLAALLRAAVPRRGNLPA
jgi:mannose-6-phosphate isomerase-like protein (cupin superfamily)